MAKVNLLGSYANSIGDGLMFRNRLINGNFDIWQRGTTGTPSPNSATGGYASADRWKFIGHESGVSFASVNLTQITDAPPNSKFAAKLVSTGAGLDDVAIGQIIESSNTHDLVGEPVTFSLYLKRLGSLTGLNTIIEISYLNAIDATPGNFLQSIPTGATVITTRTLSQSEFSNTWVKYSVKTPVLPAGAANGLMVRIFINGTNIGSGDLFAIGQAQLESGNETPFEKRPYSTELNLCQAYYEVTSIMSQTYASAMIGNSGHSYPTWGMAKWDYKVRKRINPTLQVFCGSSNFGFTSLDPGTNRLVSSSFGDFAVNGDQAGCFAFLVQNDNTLPTNPYLYDFGVRAIAEL